MSQQPTTAGQIVRSKTHGGLAVTTDPPMRRTPRIPVMFFGASYTVHADLADLEVIEELALVAPERTAVERELHPTGDEATDLAIYHAETAATYKGRDDSVRIPKAELLLILAAARR